MKITPPIVHRQQQKRARTALPGVVVSHTVVRHPPEGFGKNPITIALIELENGERVLKPIISQGEEVCIGAHVLPRMRLTGKTAQGLRIYDTAYELTARKSVKKTKEFNGYILALTGPSGVGKTTVSNLLSTKVASYTERVPILTTREPKEGDDNEYRYISLKEFAAMHKRGEIVAATQIPSETERRWYGYRSTDIEAIRKKGKVPVVVTEMHLLQGLALHFGRRSILSFGLLPPGRSKRAKLSALLHRLRTRGRDTEESIRERIRNAAEDLKFFTKRSELFDEVIVNDDLEAVFSKLQGRVVALAKV